MVRITKVVCLILSAVLAIGMTSCNSETPVSSLISATGKIVTPEEVNPPIVRVSNNNYSAKDVPSIMQLGSNDGVSRPPLEWTLSNQQSFIEAAVKQSNALNLDSENLRVIITKLETDVDQLDFQDKNMGSSGVAWTFMINNRTVQLPYLIEKAKYQGKDAWVVVLNWEMNYADDTIINLSHIAVVVFEYGSTNVLIAMSCG
jgi:hypothetical protein